MKVTTLSKIRDHNPCLEGWVNLLKFLNKTEADEEALPFKIILESNGIYDALWCMRSAPQYAKDWRLFAVFCAKQVSHLLTDERSLSAIEVAEKFANGEATREELSAAKGAAADAYEAAAAAADAAAADAAYAAADAYAAYAAYAAADAAAADAAYDAARKKMRFDNIELLRSLIK